jgi:hypothetical protein
MSEQLGNDHEKLIQPERPEVESAERPRHGERHTEAEHKAEEISETEVEAIKHRIKKESKSRDEVEVVDEESTPQGSQMLVNSELKGMAFQRTLKRVQRQLSRPERTFSKTIHRPTVDALSRAGEKTIARPAGILGGGLFALIGSIFVLYNAKQFGFKYNFLVFLILFVIGYVFGTVLEIFTRLLSKNTK